MEGIDGNLYNTVSKFFAPIIAAGFVNDMNVKRWCNLRVV